MKKNFLKIGLLAVTFLSPAIAFAEGKDLRYIMKIVTGYIQDFILLIISLAVITFIWNIYRYFFTEKDKKEAGMYVLYSVIGFFVILSFWGLVNVLTNSLSLQNEQPSWPFGSGVSSGGGIEAGSTSNKPIIEAGSTSNK